MWLSAKEMLEGKNKKIKVINLKIYFISDYTYDYKNGKKKTLKHYALGSLNISN